MGIGSFKKVAMRIFSFGLLFQAAALMTACTREIPETTATIRLGLPSSKVGGLSLTANDKLSHIVINVQGPGIPSPIFISWDGHDSSAVAPTSFTVDIPTGSARLFQALMVFQDTATGGMSFYYGDIESAVDSSTNSVTVATSAIASPAGEGHVSGRMMMDTEPLYTGPIAISYSPVSGRPPMLIEKSEVFGGWFSVFGLDGIAFNYIRNDGVQFFGAPTDVGVLHSTISSDQSKLAINVPSYWESRGGAGSREVRMAGKHVFGWFGDDPGNSSRKVCYDNTPVDIPYAYLYDDPDTTLIQWNVGGSAANARVAGGGVNGNTPDGTGLCTYSANTRFTDLLSLASKEVAHHDGTLAFRGPYQKYDYTSDGGGFLSGSVAGSTITLNWAYMPNVAEALPVKGVAGSDLFLRIIPVGFPGEIDGFRKNNSVNCSGLGAYGFTNKANIPVGTTSHSFDGNLISGDFLTAQSQSRVQYVLCPYSMAGGVKSYYGSAIYEGGYGGGGPLNVQFSASTSSVTEGSAISIPVILSSSSGSMVTVNYNVTGGTAISSLDYSSIASSGTLTFSPGNTIQYISGSAVVDADGASETIIFTLSGAAGASAGVGTTAGHTITIND